MLLFESGGGGEAVWIAESVLSAQPAPLRCNIPPTPFAAHCMAEVAGSEGGTSCLEGSDRALIPRWWTLVSDRLLSPRRVGNECLPLWSLVLALLRRPLCARASGTPAGWGCWVCTALMTGTLSQ